MADHSMTVMVHLDAYGQPHDGSFTLYCDGTALETRTQAIRCTVPAPVAFGFLAERALTQLEWHVTQCAYRNPPSLNRAPLGA